MKKNLKIAAQGGFTLIELIVVIVILGILAATALPKFASLSGDARNASLMAAKASLSSVSAMSHGKHLVAPIADGSSLKMENIDVPMKYGYPQATGALASAAGLSTDDYIITPLPTAAASAANTTVTVSPKNVADATKCVVTYTQATSTSVPPTISFVNSDCN